MNELRARQLGWQTPSLLPTGPWNAITDVPGVLVGHTTLIQGDAGPLQVGKGPVRTGVTAIRPHAGNLFTDRVAAGVHVLNGYGKTTGLEQVRELGILETPILLTNTLSVWRCADALLDWMLQDNPGIGITASTLNPVIGECNDGWLNDIQGRHVTPEHVFSALESAHSNLVAEGSIGAGTGTMCYQFKGGIGTASRVLPDVKGAFTVAVLLQANFGTRHQLVIRGLPVGQLLANWPDTHPTALSAAPEDPGMRNSRFKTEAGSCMIVIATDAPLNARQLGRLARRAPLGLARTGFTSNPGSGDYIIAFSTTSRSKPNNDAVIKPVERWVDEGGTFGLLIQGVVEATEEAVLNALIAAKTMAGRDGHIAHALPVDIIQELRTVS